jgi:hypothetical protein
MAPSDIVSVLEVVLPVAGFVLSFAVTRVAFAKVTDEAEV